MDYRMNKGAIIGVGVLLLLAAGVFAYTWLSKEDEPEAAAQEEVQNEEPERIITAMHQFEDGTHTVAGETDMPTPCEKLDTEVFFADGNQSRPEIRFTTVNESEEMCAQVITPARFKVEFDAPENATISGTLNGTPVRLNLVEVPEGENLDDFELFIKG